MQGVRGGSGAGERSLKACFRRTGLQATIVVRFAFERRDSGTLDSG